MKKHSTKIQKVEFCDMTKSEKKKFLSMDLAERMIRIEQRVSAHFHKNVPYNETEYYKGMTPLERTEFERHIRANRTKKICLTALIVIPTAILMALNMSLTASVVKDNLGIDYSNSTKFFIWAGTMIFAIAVLIKSFSRRVIESHDDSHLDIFNKLSIGRRMKGKKKGF
ncbi:MAG: hypothetical protein AABX17_00575 [Nanoarchaeota archaeon]